MLVGSVSTYIPICGRARQDKPNGAHRRWCHCGAPYAVVDQQGASPERMCSQRKHFFSKFDVRSWNRTFHKPPGPHSYALCVGHPCTGVGEEQAAFCRDISDQGVKTPNHDGGCEWRILCSKCPVNWNLLKMCCVHAIICWHVSPLGITMELRDFFLSWFRDNNVVLLQEKTKYWIWKPKPFRTPWHWRCCKVVMKRRVRCKAAWEVLRSLTIDFLEGMFATR